MRRSPALLALLASAPVALSPLATAAAQPAAPLAAPARDASTASLLEAARVARRVQTSTSGAPALRSAAAAPVATLYHDQADPAAPGGWRPQTRTDYAYSGGLLSSMTERAWSGTAWVDQSRSVFQYDGARLQSSTDETWNGSAWVPVTRELYTVTGPSVQHATSSVWSGGTWVTTERVSYTMSNGHVVATQLDTLDMGVWKPRHRDAYTDVDGAVVLTQEAFDLGAWAFTERAIYAGHTRASLDAAFEAALEPLQVGAYLAFRFPDHTTEEWSGSAWLRDTRQVTLANDAGLPYSVTQSAWTGSSWDSYYRTTFAHDGLGQLAAATFQMSGGTMWVDNSGERYTRVDGRITEVRSHIYIGATTQVQSRRRVVYAQTTDAPASERPADGLALAAPAPHPVRGAATLAYTLDAAGEATLALYDLTGRAVATLASGAHAAGAHTATLDAAGLPAGVYLARLSASGRTTTRRIVLAR